MSGLSESDAAELKFGLRALLGAHADITANHIKPLVEQIVQRHVEEAVAAFKAEAVAAIEALPGPGGEGIARWPKRDQDAYLLAIEESISAVRNHPT